MRAQLAGLEHLSTQPDHRHLFQNLLVLIQRLARRQERGFQSPPLVLLFGGTYPPRPRPLLSSCWLFSCILSSPAVHTRPGNEMKGIHPEHLFTPISAELLRPSGDPEASPQQPSLVIGHRLASTPDGHCASSLVKVAPPGTPSVAGSTSREDRACHVVV
jgi:hypothetical protein